MSYNSNLPVDVIVSTADVRENFRALKEDKIVAAATAMSADSAEKLTTARKISLTGDVAGSTIFDGSADVTIAVDVKGGNADTLDGKTVNDIIAAAMPVGAVIMWSGSIALIPNGWHLCDGTNGTPDLRNRFVVGAGSDSGNGYVPNTSEYGIGLFCIGDHGGQGMHLLTLDELPSHFHKDGRGTWNHYYGGGTTIPSWLDTTSGEGNPLIENANTSTEGGNQPHNSLPPYYSLAYIMKL